ncbi:MAG: glycosyl transferase family 2 [Humibacillus sp.]|nr:glycosyl transferase family 2 [Humibacillus sp.]
MSTAVGSGAAAAEPLPVAVVIPARDEAGRIAATVESVRHLPGVQIVVVVDDGSSDATASLAAQHGAEVVRHPRSHGKADALMSGIGRLTGLRRVGRVAEATPVLFLDADLDVSPAAFAALVGPVATGVVDLTVATFGGEGRGRDSGGHAVLVSLARRGVEELTGLVPTQPLSGLRCLSPAAVAAATPFARGWGVEVGMTIDVLDAGLVLLEVPCDVSHRAVGTDWRAQVHRAGQYRDIALAIGVRRLRRRLGPG